MMLRLHHIYILMKVVLVMHIHSKIWWITLYSKERYNKVISRNRKKQYHQNHNQRKGKWLYIIKQYYTMKKNTRRAVTHCLALGCAQVSLSAFLSSRYYLNVSNNTRLKRKKEHKCWAAFCWPIKPAIALILQERHDQMNQSSSATAWLSRQIENLRDGQMEELEITGSRSCKMTTSRSFPAQIRWHDLGTSVHGLELSYRQHLFNRSLCLFPSLPCRRWNPSLQDAPHLSYEAACLLGNTSTPPLSTSQHA
jgi:hypothetical protein